MLHHSLPVFDAMLHYSLHKGFIDTNIETLLICSFSILLLTIPCPDCIFTRQTGTNKEILFQLQIIK